MRLTALMLTLLISACLTPSVFVQANDAELAGDYSRAASLYRDCGSAGDAFCQFQLGTLYADGKGVGKSELEAIEWYRKAARQKLPVAQSVLAASITAYALQMQKGLVPKADVSLDEALAWAIVAERKGQDTADLQRSIAQHQNPMALPAVSPSNLPIFNEITSRY